MFSFVISVTLTDAPAGTVSDPTVFPPDIAGNSIGSRNLTSLGQFSWCSINQTNGSGRGVGATVSSGDGLGAGASFSLMNSRARFVRRVQVSDGGVCQRYVA